MAWHGTTQHIITFKHESDGVQLNRSGYSIEILIQRLRTRHMIKTHTREYGLNHICEQMKQKLNREMQCEQSRTSNNNPKCAVTH